MQKEIDDARRSADDEIVKRNAGLKEYREKLAKLDADIHLAELMSGGGGAESVAAAATQKDPLQSQLDSLMQVIPYLFRFVYARLLSRAKLTFCCIFRSFSRRKVPFSKTRRQCRM